MLINSQKRIRKRLTIAKQKYRQLVNIYHDIIEDPAVINSDKESVDKAVNLLHEANTILQNIHTNAIVIEGFNARLRIANR